MSKEHPRIIEYVQGACIATSPTFLLFIALSFSDPELDIFIHTTPFMNTSVPTLSIVAFLITLTSTTIAGFLVAGRVTHNRIRASIYTGVFSYPFFLLYRILFYPSGILPEAWTFIIFLAGGSLGGLLRRLLYY